MVTPALEFQFKRQVREYARWLAVPEADRSPAPGWWWGPAFAARDSSEPLPAAWTGLLRLPAGACYADAARLFLGAMAEQAFQPWPSAFPGREPLSDAQPPA